MSVTAGYGSVGGEARSKVSGTVAATDRRYLLEQVDDAAVVQV